VKSALLFAALAVIGCGDNVQGLALDAAGEPVYVDSGFPIVDAPAEAADAGVPADAAGSDDDGSGSDGSGHHHGSGGCGGHHHHGW
jgi:hypothetical protein